MRTLIVAPYFPPYAGVGMARMASLATHLTESGHDVYVLSDDPTTYDLTNDMYDIKSVTRISVPDHTGFLASAKVYYLKIKELLLSHEQFDNIILTVGPFYNLLYLHKIAKLINLHSTPIVLDVRDFWLSNNNFLGKLYDRFVKHRILKRAFKFASKIVVVCEGMANLFTKEFGLDRNKFEIIHNGYGEYDDNALIAPDILDEITRLHMHTDLIIAINGSFSNYSKASAEIGLSSLVHPNLKIGFLHIGKYDSAITEYIANKRTNSDYLLATGFQSYDVSMKLLSCADIFLVTNRTKLGLSTKIFDYFRLNKPIILIDAVDSELSIFLSRFKNSFVCTSTRELHVAINLINDQDINVLDDAYEVGRYSRTIQNEKYLSLLQNL